jgi:DNA repair protein RecO (recombination protein O)
MTADAVAETVLASHGGGGNWSKALALTEAALDALAEADSGTCARILLWFLWQWVDFLGLRPEFDKCSHCGKTVSGREMLMFSLREGVMLCETCNGEERQGTGFVEAGPGCRHWLETTGCLSPTQLTRYTLDLKSFRESKSLATAILAEALGKRLNSWELVVSYG